MGALASAEIFGFAAMALGLFGHSMQNPRYALMFLFIPSALWVVHFFLLAQFSGLIVTALAAFRNLCGARLSLPKMRATTIFFLLTTYIILVPSVYGYLEALPLLAALVFSAAVFCRDIPKRFRVCNMSGQGIWLVYALGIASMSLAIYSALMILTIMLAMYRYDRKAVIV